MDEKKNVPETLTDEQLKEVFGAESLVLGKTDDPLFPVKFIFDDSFREIGKIWKSIACYWPCPNCGRPTHYSWFRYWCDKCDASWSSINLKPWPGTPESLIDAANNN